MASTNRHGTLYWLEIPVLSAPRAAAFYAAVLGWECDVPRNNSSSSSTSPSASSSTSPQLHANGTSSTNAPPVTFHAFRSRMSSRVEASSTQPSATIGVPLQGAFIQVPEDRLLSAWDTPGGSGRAAVLTTFAVGSIEGALARVSEMGGRTQLPKTAIGDNMGYFARFIDCEGNLQGLWAET